MQRMEKMTCGGFSEDQVWLSVLDSECSEMHKFLFNNAGWLIVSVIAWEISDTGTVLQGITKPVLISVMQTVTQIKTETDCEIRPALQQFRLGN